MEESTNLSLVPCVCSGKVTSKIENNETYEVQIYKSPIGELNGPIYATLISQPGAEKNLKPGTYVKVLVMFTFGGPIGEAKFLDVHSNSANHILGSFVERSVTNIDIDHPFSEMDDDRVRWAHPGSRAGMIATKTGKVSLVGSGSIYSLLSPGGFGINENCHRTFAQNHQRHIAYNPKKYLSKEIFGMFSGKDSDDKALLVSPKDHFINLRRFITQTKDIDNWISTCEGAYAPYVGANNDWDEVSASKEVLFSKVINHSNLPFDTRLTVEAGDPGDGFLNIRIDDVQFPEKYIPVDPGATPAILGNRFKLRIGDKGELDIRAAGQGIAGANLNGLHISVDTSGMLKIHAAAGIEISHGDIDGATNSITMDPAKGIDIKTALGFRVNGKGLVNEQFFDWFNTWATTWTPVVSPPGPAPMNPAAIVELTAKRIIPDVTGGFMTALSLGIPPTRIIADADLFTSV